MRNPFQYIIKHCIPFNVRNLLVLYDSTSNWILKYFGEFEKNFEFVQINQGHCHGEELPQDVFLKVINSEGIICVTKYSLAHTSARFEAQKKHIPFLSMPGLEEKIVNNDAFFADYGDVCSIVDMYADLLTNTKLLHITSCEGTDLFINVENRTGNSCPGLTDDRHLLGSPPDIEANIAPIETETNGVIVVDGSITDWRIGLLKEKVILNVEDGYVTGISCTDKQIEYNVKKILNEIKSEKAYVVGELGIGFNSAARLCGNMLIDEGTLGCIHFGLGSNWTIGGKNMVSFHLDFVVRDASIETDNKIIVKKGKLSYGN